MAAGFVELRWDVHQVVSEGDHVVVRATGRTLHRPGGNFFGIPGSGQRTDFPIVWWFRFASGKIAP